MNEDTRQGTGPGNPESWRYNSGWNSFRLPAVSVGLLAHRAEESLAHLQRMGVTVRGGNRLQSAIRRQREINDREDPLRLDERELLDDLSDGLRTMFEAFLVVHTALARPRERTPFTPEALACFVEGAERAA